MSSKLEDWLFSRLSVAICGFTAGLMALLFELIWDARALSWILLGTGLFGGVFWFLSRASRRSGVTRRQIILFAQILSLLGLAILSFASLLRCRIEIGEWSLGCLLQGGESRWRLLVEIGWPAFMIWALISGAFLLDVYLRKARNGA